MSQSLKSPPLSSLFIQDRCKTTLLQRCFLLLYIPFGILLFCFRLIIGVHIFLTACILRKTMLLRCTVLRVMSCLLGVVVFSGGSYGSWDQKTKVLVSNHVSTLDHMAVDLIEPCILPSVWDIPTLLRWCFGYTDLGVREGRTELIRRARDFCDKSPLPLLTFPEGAMTGGQKGMLKFSSWPFEVSDSVQPVLITVHRPLFGFIAPSVLGGAWWQDVFYFLFVPFTIIKVRWLHPLLRKVTGEGESAESADDFAKRAENIIASKLGLASTNYTSQDAVEEAKRHLEEKRHSYINLLSSNSQSSKQGIWKHSRTSSEYLDCLAMKIKQAFPAVSLMKIREDLEKTQDGNATCERISSGKIKMGDGNIESSLSSSSKMLSNSDTSQWRKLYSSRKWYLIEENRAKYLKRVNARLSDIERRKLE